MNKTVEGSINAAGKTSAEPKNPVANWSKLQTESKPLAKQKNQSDPKAHHGAKGGSETQHEAVCALCF